MSKNRSGPVRIYQEHKKGGLWLGHDRNGQVHRSTAVDSVGRTYTGDWVNDRAGADAAAIRKMNRNS